LYDDNFYFNNPVDYNIEPKATIARWIAEARREIGKLGGWARL